MRGVAAIALALAAGQCARAAGAREPGKAKVQEAEFLEALKAWSQEKPACGRARAGFQGLVNSEPRYPTRANFLEPRGQVIVDCALHEQRFSVAPA